MMCIGFAVFLSIFAMDVFGMPLDLGQKALALLMHLIPSFVVLLALGIAWRLEWIGVVIFPLLAVVHVVSKPHLDWTDYVVIDGPLLLLAILFWINWRQRGVLRPATGQEPGARGRGRYFGAACDPSNGIFVPRMSSSGFSSKTFR